MKIVLQISVENNMTLSLFEGKEEKDNLKWEDGNSLSLLLLPNLEKLLQRSGFGLDPHTNSAKKGRNTRHKNKRNSKKIGGGVDKISGYKIISEVPKKWTSYRIAEITFRTLKLSHNT